MMEDIQIDFFNPSSVDPNHNISSFECVDNYLMRQSSRSFTEPLPQWHIDLPFKAPANYKEEPVLISEISEKTDYAPVCQVVESEVISTPWWMDDPDEIMIPEGKITAPKEHNEKPIDSAIKTTAEKTVDDNMIWQSSRYFTEPLPQWLIDLPFKAPANYKIPKKKKVQESQKQPDSRKFNFTGDVRCQGGKMPASFQCLTSIPGQPDQWNGRSIEEGPRKSEAAR